MRENKNRLKVNEKFEFKVELNLYIKLREFSLISYFYQTF